MSNGEPLPPPAGGQMPHDPDPPGLPDPDQQDYNIGTETDQQPGT